MRYLEVVCSGPLMLPKCNPEPLSVVVRDHCWTRTTFPFYLSGTYNEDLGFSDTLRLRGIEDKFDTIRLCIPC